MARIFAFILFLVLSFPIFAASKVLLVVIPGCHYCAEAKSLLNSKGISYKTEVAKQGAVPRLYVNGQLQGTGLDAVQSWVSRQPSRR